MPLTRQHIEGEHLMRWNRPNEGVVMRWEDIQHFLTDFERMNRPEETIQFYWRKTK